MRLVMGLRVVALLAFVPALSLAQSAEPSATPAPDPSPVATSLAVSGTTKSGESERIAEAAAQVTVLTSEEISVFGHRTLADLIENAPESFVGGDRTYPILGLRGFARAGDRNTRVLLLLDGHTLNEPWNNYAPADTDLPLDLTQVDRVEILAGPVSALYGSNAFFGALQIVTRKPAKPTAGGSITGGSSRYGRGTAWYGDGNERAAIPWSVLVSATGMYSGGEQIEYDDLGTERDTDWDRNGSVLLRAHAGRVSVLASAFGRRRGVIGGAYDATFGDDRNLTEDTHALVDVSVAAIERERLKLKLRGYGDWYRFEDVYRYDPDPVFHDRATSTWGGGEAVLTWLAGTNRLVATLEATSVQVIMDAFQREDAGTIAPDPDAPPNSVPIDRRSFGVVRGTLHDALRVGERTRLEAGVYAEAHEDYGVQAAPRAAAVLQAPGSVTLKALYGRGFRSPSVYERYYDDDDAVTGNEDLGAETADVFELSAGKTIGTRSDVYVSGFHGEYRDLMVLDTIDLDPTPGGEDLRAQFRNGATARSSGATFAFQTRHDHWVLWADVTGFRHDEETLAATQGAPEWVAHTVALVRVSDRVTVGARASGVGARPARVPGERLDPYVIADLSVRVGLGGGLFARVSGTNLLAARAAHPASEEYVMNEIPGVGPRGFLELRWER